MLRGHESIDACWLIQNSILRIATIMQQLLHAGEHAGSFHQGKVISDCLGRPSRPRSVKQVQACTQLLQGPVRPH